MTPGSGTSRGRRRGLALQLALVTTAVALVSVAVATFVSVRLVRNAVTSAAEARLARDADLVAGLAPRPNSAVPARRALRAAGIRVATVGPQGAVHGDLPLTDADVEDLLAGHDVSARRRVAGQTLVVEGRPVAAGGGVVIAQPTGVSAAVDRRIRRAELAALAAGALGGALAGVALASRVTRPLRATAAAAHRLAAGDRAVRVGAAGPAEVAEVGLALDSLADALGSSERRQREFLLSVSHELRTPLTTLRGFAESLADGVTTGADVPAAGATMVAEAERLDRLVGDLLDLARLDADDVRIDRSRVDLAGVVREAGTVWAVRCRDVGVALRVEAPPDPIVVDTDAGRVRQIVDGLAENALRVTPSGRPVVLAARVERGGAVVEVRDGGPGLRDEDLPVAFDRSVLYDRYRGVRRVGTGLGLAIVGRLAARLGGHAEVGHAPEGGACFRVWLPLGAASVEGRR